jgi:chromosome segregation ATPase
VKALEEIVEKLPENLRLPLYEAFQVFRESLIIKEHTEIKSEINKVWSAIKELTEAQKKTWDAIKELAEAQKRNEQEINKVWSAIKEIAEAQKKTEERFESFKKSTEENFNKVWNAIRELAEAQKRTEKRLEELAEAQKKTEQRLEELAEAQKKTEKRLEELAEAQKRTEQRLEELAEAQKKTEERLQKLIQEHAKTREQLGGLSHAFGYVLEDRAIKSLPKILKQNFNIETIGKLKREFFKIGKEYIEINIYGTVRKDGEQFTLIGEAKSRVSKKAIDEFIKKCEKISPRSIKILVSYIFSPEIQEYAQAKDIILIPSYELEL